MIYKNKIHNNMNQYQMFVVLMWWFDYLIIIQTNRKPYYNKLNHLKTMAKKDTTIVLGVAVADKKYFTLTFHWIIKIRRILLLNSRSQFLKRTYYKKIQLNSKTKVLLITLAN